MTAPLPGGGGIWGVVRCREDPASPLDSGEQGSPGLLGGRSVYPSNGSNQPYPCRTGEASSQGAPGGHGVGDCDRPTGFVPKTVLHPITLPPPPPPPKRISKQVMQPWP